MFILTTAKPLLDDCCRAIGMSALGQELPFPLPQSGHSHVKFHTISRIRKKLHMAVVTHSPAICIVVLGKSRNWLISNR